MQDKVTITVLNGKSEVLNTSVWENANSAKAFLFDLVMESQRTGQYEVEELYKGSNQYYVWNYEV